MGKPRIAVHKFSSCDGCQLQFLTLEQELLILAERVDIVHFHEATSQFTPGPYDVSFVEGSVSARENLGRIKQIREESRYLVVIGACGTAGGIQALRNWGKLDAFLRAVYASPAYIDILEYSTPFSDHVKVDAELWGCPPDQGQLKRVLTDLLVGVTPRMPTESVCIQCKRDGNVCVLVAKGEPCMGPITRTGCGALCPHQERDCYGCFGPQGGGNIKALGRRFLGLGLSPEAVSRRLRFIYGWEPAFREAAKDWDVNGSHYTPLPPRRAPGKPS